MEIQIPKTYFILQANPKFMKQKVFLLITICFLHLSAIAQQKPPYTSIKPQLEEVIKDFPNYFKTIKGKPVSEVVENMEYVSEVNVKNSLETKVIDYSNRSYTSWVWECKLFETENLDELKRQYKLYYNDISGKSLIGKTSANNLVAVSPYSSPSAELRLWSNQFVVNKATDEYKNLVVDLVAEYINFQWAVYVRVYDKEKDEEIRPTSKQ